MGACEFPPSCVRNPCESNANFGRSRTVWGSTPEGVFIGVDRLEWWSWGDLNPRAAQAACGFRPARANYVRFCGAVVDLGKNPHCMPSHVHDHVTKYSLSTNRPVRDTRFKSPCSCVPCPFGGALAGSGNAAARAFCVFSVRARIGIANGPCRGRTRDSDGAFDPRRPGLSQGPERTSYRRIHVWPTIRALGS